LLIGLPVWVKPGWWMSTVMGLHGTYPVHARFDASRYSPVPEVLKLPPTAAAISALVEGLDFCQLLMADEINRASSRTQISALQSDAGKKSPRVNTANWCAVPRSGNTKPPTEQEKWSKSKRPKQWLDRFWCKHSLSDRSTERLIFFIATITGAPKKNAAVFTTKELLAAQVLLVPYGGRCHC
jgi:hypothetical protein